MAATLTGDVNAVRDHRRFAGTFLVTGGGQTVPTRGNIEREQESH